MLYSYRSAWQPPDGQEENAVGICKYMLYVLVTVWSGKFLTDEPVACDHVFEYS